MKTKSQNTKAVNEMFTCITEDCTVNQVLNYYLDLLEDEPNYQEPEKQSELYPCLLSYYSPGDLTPNDYDRPYKIHDLDAKAEELDSEYYGEYNTLYEIPSRFALYQLIHDLCRNMATEIQCYASLSSPSSPLDDATGDIEIASDIIHLLTDYDTQF